MGSGSCAWRVVGTWSRAVRAGPATDPSTSLAERAWVVLQNASKPISRKALRETLRVNNQRLGEALETLKRQGLIVHTDRGWMGVRATASAHPEGDASAALRKRIQELGFGYRRMRVFQVAGYVFDQQLAAEASLSLRHPLRDVVQRFFCVG